MADHGPQPPVGDDVLEEVTEALVRLHERYHGRRPVTARSQMMGEDMLACLLGEVYTDVEKTMIEMQREALVKETRSAFQQAMGSRFIREVERLTERRVAQFLSTHSVGPDLELELFVLDSEAVAPPRPHAVGSTRRGHSYRGAALRTEPCSDM